MFIWCWLLVGEYLLEQGVGVDTEQYLPLGGFVGQAFYEFSRRVGVGVGQGTVGLTEQLHGYAVGVVYAVVCE